MITQLPRWIEYGAFLLAFVAGVINAIGLLGVEHQAISHLSGTATQLGASLLQGSTSLTLHLSGIIVSFFAGATLCGVLLRSSALKLGRHYDTVLAIEAALLFSAMHLLSHGNYVGLFAASMACGLQNAMITTYSGAIIRTTHLTGIVTDLGLMLGDVLRGAALPKRKVALFCLIASGFILGGTVGAALFNWLAFWAFAIPATICTVLALSYRLYCITHPDQLPKRQ